MINKIKTAEDAIADVKDGAVIMIAGFLGTGTPEILIDALVKKGVKNLTIIANDGGLPAGAMGHEKPRGIGKLLAAGMVKHIIASHVGMNPLIGKGMNDKTLECTLVPQGTLAERIRAAGAGLGGVLTATGVGTIIAEGKVTIQVDGKDYLLEKPLKADFAFCRASLCDTFGNFTCNLATKNFNPLMATAADTVILATEKMLEVGENSPDAFSTSGIYVDYIVGGEEPWQI